MTIPLRQRLPVGSSCQPGPLGLKRPWGLAPRDPYLALLPVGLAVPPLLPEARWALTPPFHPYPRERGRSVFCGAFRRIAPPGRYPAPLLQGVRTFLETKASRPSNPPRGVHLGFWPFAVNAIAGREIGNQRHILTVERAFRPGPEPKPNRAEQMVETALRITKPRSIGGKL